MSRIAILDGYGDFADYGESYGAHRGGKKKRKGRRRKFSAAQKRQHARFRKAAKSCGRRRKGSFESCMKKMLKKGRR